jgi:hypothetical protein
MSARTKQVLLTIFTLASASAITYFTNSAWHFAPVVLALLVNLRTVFGMPPVQATGPALMAEQRSPSATMQAVGKVVK